MTAVAVYPNRLAHSNETISREVAKSTVITSVNLSKLFKEIRDIKARNPSLYLALARDDPSLIR
jgi:hypothetical protein